MATILKECNASVRGERQLAAHLSAIDDAKLSLLFNIDFIPGGREIDLLLIHDEIGVFLIEVKGIGIDAIKSISPTNWGIDNRDTSESPLLQAYRQYEGLRDFLKPHVLRLPFIAVTVCLPKISRVQWLERFASSVFATSVCDSMLFEEDLYGGKENLYRKLRHIHLHPPVRQGKECREPSSDFLNVIRRILAPALPVVPTITERERLRAIEQGITAKLQSEFPPDNPRRALFAGLPGTGKTFRLLSIGAFHSYSGRRVLFACFNKTLASDIRRLLSFSDKLRATPFQMEILDVNQLALRCFEMNGIDFIDSKDADDWGELLVDELDRKESPSIHQYDLILVDESQDMKAWQLDLLDLHASDQASFVIAVGEGQELYRDAASATGWINAHHGIAATSTYRLLRNFRNPKKQYFFAQAFFDAWPDKFAQIDTCKASMTKKSKQGVLFDREQGEGPRYISLPVRREEFDDLGSMQDALVAETFLDVISETYERMMADNNSHPVGLLILVPSPEGLHSRAARLALQDLCSDGTVDFIDYTLEDVRRASASQNQIRLCTFHSARGLEGEYVIVFGLETIESISEVSSAPPQNLAFVALSRGVFSTTIAVRSNPRTKVHVLCERVLQAI